MKKVLAYRFSAFGDVAMVASVCREFLEQNSDTQLFLISRGSFEALFDEIPGLVFMGIDLDEYKGFWGMRRLFKELKDKIKPDYIADLHDVIRTKILTKLFKRAGFNVGVLDKGKEEKEHLIDIWNLEKKPLRMTVERYGDVFRGLGFSLTLSHHFFSKIKEKSGIGIAPFAQHKGKVLPLEKSFEVAKILSEHNKIYFFGGGEEETKILEDWEQKIPNSYSLAGKTNLREELQRISTLEVMISMDSANMHLASLMGTRCISVWGATHPYAGFLGYGQSEEDVVQVDDLTCRPCSVYGEKECYRGDYACLYELDIKKIIEKIKK